MLNADSHYLKKERDCQKVVCGLFRQSLYLY